MGTVSDAHARPRQSKRLQEDVMTGHVLLEPGVDIDHSTDDLARTILDRIEDESVLSLDSLMLSLPHYSWNQILIMVDRLARDGRLILRRHRFDYTLFSKHYAA